MTNEEIFKKFCPNIRQDWDDDDVLFAIKLARKQGRLEFKPFLDLILKYFDGSQRTKVDEVRLFLQIKGMIPNLPKEG